MIVGDDSFNEVLKKCEFNNQKFTDCKLDCNVGGFEFSILRW